MNPGDCYSGSWYNNYQRINQPQCNPPFPPPRGSEIIVGSLPNDLNENQLIRIFSLVGPIWRLRLMAHGSTAAGACCFITYFNADDANMATWRFNQRLVKSATKTTMMTVAISPNDYCKLFLRQIPMHMSCMQVANRLQVCALEALTKIVTYSNQENPDRNLGYALLEFRSHAAASLARRKMLSGLVRPWAIPVGEGLIVDWAEADPLPSSQMKTMYPRNVSVGWNAELAEMFLRERPLTITDDQIRVQTITEVTNNSRLSILPGPSTSAGNSCSEDAD